MEYRWDEENVEHLGRHGITPHIANDVLAVGEYLVLSSPNSPANRKAVVGYTSRNRFVTVIAEPTEQPNVWRPVTGWWSTPKEVARYTAVKARR